LIPVQSAAARATLAREARLNKVEEIICREGMEVTILETGQEERVVGVRRFCMPLRVVYPRIHLSKVVQTCPSSREDPPWRPIRARPFSTKNEYSVTETVCCGLDCLIFADEVLLSTQLCHLMSLYNARLRLSNDIPIVFSGVRVKFGRLKTLSF
jgi:hypothetical protein